MTFVYMYFHQYINRQQQQLSNYLTDTCIYYYETFKEFRSFLLETNCS